MNLYGFVGNNSLSEWDGLGLAWGNMDFVYHFFTGGGSNVTLSQIGLFDLVNQNIEEQGIKDRFKKQIGGKAASYCRSGGKGPFFASFLRGYDFMSVRYSLAGGTLGGLTDVVKVKCIPCVGGDPEINVYKFKGEVRYIFKDEFTDPLSVREILTGSSKKPPNPFGLIDFWDIFSEFGGQKYIIYENWKEGVSGKGFY